VLVEQLGTYSKNLKILERVSLVANADAQWVSENLRATQERERKEIEERIAEYTHYINDSIFSYQSLIDDIHQSKVVSKTAEDVIASARVTIDKA